MEHSKIEDDEVFELLEVNSKQVILKVHAEDALACARHPYVDSDMAMITVTRGRDHTLSIFDRQGRNTCSFDWGYSRRTMIDSSLDSLRKHAVDFILGQGILLDSQSDKCTRAVVYWNSWRKSWQLACETPAYSTNFWFGGTQTEEGFRQAKKEIQELFPGIKGFERTSCATGIPIWAAKIGRYGLKGAPAKPSAEPDPELERACRAFDEAAENANLPASCRLVLEAQRLEDGGVRFRASVSDPDEAIYRQGKAPACKETFKARRGERLPAEDALLAFAERLEKGDGTAAVMPKGLRSTLADAVRRGAEAITGPNAEEDEDCGPRP